MAVCGCRAREDGSFSRAPLALTIFLTSNTTIHASQGRVMSLLSIRLFLWRPIFALFRDKKESVEEMVRRHPSHRRVRWDPDGRRGLPEGEDAVPLLCAILCDDVMIVRTLLECGADPVRLRPLAPFPR